ncbi:DUF4296 domain-containing protein [Chitinophaga alhagiae]|uniref:DUF4296 domain-containing protein n=1 Tax=Chitinophaga alhagiae TaxID=2203219 RepID=UPI000E5BAB15|nr:DUF4296 domain-containing protein [Chitinophaga alhagiae]
MMNLRKTVGVLLFSVLLACGQADRTPKGVLPPEKMRDILLDMNYAEVYGRDQGVDTVHIADSVREQHIKRYYVQILQLHNVTKDEFLNSYRFYELHSDRLEEIYKQMQAIVQRRREVMDSIERKQSDLKYGIERRTHWDSLYCPADSLRLILP